MIKLFIFNAFMRWCGKSITVAETLKKQVMLHTQNSLMNGKRKKLLKEEECVHRLRNYLDMFVREIMAWNQSLRKTVSGCMSNYMESLLVHRLAKNGKVIQQLLSKVLGLKHRFQTLLLKCKNDCMKVKFLDKARKFQIWKTCLSRYSCHGNINFQEQWHAIVPR